MIFGIKQIKYHSWYFKSVSNFFSRLTAREITYNNFEISLVLFMPNITTNHAITYTNTTVVAIFSNACLWRRSLYSNLVLILKTNCIKPPSNASTAYVVVIRPSFLSDSFVKIWATCEIFLGKWFTAHPGKKFPVRLWIKTYSFSSIAEQESVESNPANLPHNWTNGLFGESKWRNLVNLGWLWQCKFGMYINCCYFWVRVRPKNFLSLSLSVSFSMFPDEDEAKTGWEKWKSEFTL